MGDQTWGSGGYLTPKEEESAKRRRNPSLLSSDASDLTLSDASTVTFDKYPTSEHMHAHKCNPTPPPSFQNVTHPSFVDSYLTIGHPVTIYLPRTRLD